jgi:class 3 adenylate cyclase
VNWLTTLPLRGTEVGIVESFGGRTFKPTGDGAMAVFDDPIAAMSPDAQSPRALASLERRPRASLHVRVVGQQRNLVERKQ